MKQTTNTLLALVATVASASAATLISSDFSNYNGATDDQGNWHGQRVSLTSTGWTGTFETQLTSVSFLKDTSGGDNATIGLIVTETQGDIAGAAAYSTNTFNPFGEAAGTTLTWNFANDVLDSATTYHWQFVQDTNANGVADAGDTTLGTVRLANVGSGGTDILEPANNSIAAFNGGTNGTNGRDLYMSITTVPEPSSTALIGLGGLALILRRRK